MSFDVSLGCKHCGSSVMEFNITHNINSIVEACIVHAAANLGVPLPAARCGTSCYAERSWGRFEGWSGFDAAPILESAVRASLEPEYAAGFRKMEPDNGWGHLEDVQGCLRELHEACVKCPQGVIHASG